MAGGDDAVTAGRGFLVIAGAKVYFILASALIALGLPRMLGDPALFGQFKVVSSLLTVFNMVLITGTIHTVSRLTAGEHDARDVRRVALRTQLVVGGILSGGLFLFAPLISRLAFKDVSFAPYVRVGSGVVFCYSLYAVLIGLMNGLKRFPVQALMDMLFSTLKAGLIVGLVLAGFGVMGAFTGFLAAAIITVTVAAFAVARVLPATTDAPRLETRKLLTLLAPMLGSSLMLNLLLQLDVLSIKALLSEPVSAQMATHGGPELRASVLGMDTVPSGADAVKIATDRLAGFFGGAKNISQLPYSATFALTFVVFPMLSRSVFEGNTEQSATYVRQALRFTLVAAGSLCATLMAVANPLLTILLGYGYGISTGALHLLLASTVLLSLMVLAVTILNAAGAERRGLLLSAGTVVIYMVALYILVPSAPDVGSGALTRTAMASALAMTAGFGAFSLELYRRFGAWIPLPTLARVLVSGTLIWGLGSLWPVASLVGLVAKSASLGLIFLAAMAGLGELGPADRAAIVRIIGKRS